MATLEKIRNKAGLLVGIVGLALFAFIIGDFLNSGSTFFRQTQEKIANVNGNVITIQDYKARIDEMVEIYRMQTGANSVPEESLAQLRQNVFDSMVREIIMGETTSDLGLIVTPEELFDLVQGETVSPILQQMPMFANPQTGQFDKVALLNFLKTIDDDNIASLPVEQQGQLIQARDYWLFLERTIKQEALNGKYATLLGKAISANVLDAKDEFDASAVNSDIAYTMQAYYSVPDSLFEISNSELKSLYEQRKSLFKQSEGRVIKYITADIAPSQEDFDAAKADIEQVREELVNSDNVADLVNENSDVPYLNAFVSENNLDAELRVFVKEAKVGDVFGPVFDSNRHRLAKLVDKTVAPDSMEISLLVVPNRETREATQVLTDSLRNVANKGGNFADLVRQYSLDVRSAENGGDLGWVTEAGVLANWGENFKTAIFSTKVNDVAVVEHTGTTYLIKVTDRTANITKYKVANIETEVSPSSKTYSNIYNALNQCVANNKDLKKLEDAAREAGYNVVSNVTVTAGDQMVGFIRNSRQVVQWAFSNDKGKVSDIFECDDKFIVAAVLGKVSEGYRPLESVSLSLRTELINKKKGEKIVQDLTSKNLTSLDAYAEEMGGSVDSVKFVNFSTYRISGIGVEPKLNSAITLAKENQLSTPVAGNSGVYVFNVYAREASAEEYDEAKILQFLNENFYRMSFQGAIQELVSNADVVDNRIRFY